METMDIIQTIIHIIEYYNDENGTKKKRKVKKPKNKFEVFIERLKKEYHKHLSGDIKRRR